GLSGRLVPFLLCSEAMGMSMGVAFTATGALICEVVPVETRGLAMGGCITCICFDMMVSPATVGMLFREVGFRVGFLPAAFFTAFTACFFYLAFRNHYRQKDSAVLEAGWNREEVSSARPLVCSREGRQKWNPAAFSG
ncbi:MAG: MFS transporter, partial [Syntrophobacteraceae bacterium]